jgi:hypothetical protein
LINTTTTGPTTRIANPVIAPTADVIVAPLISDAPEYHPETPAGGRIGHRDVLRSLPQPDDRPGQEIGRAWIHTETPEWVYVSISDAPDTDESVTCALITPTGTTINLGAFTLHNGHADWATPTTIDPNTLHDAQLTIQLGHTLARAAFTAPEQGKDPDHRLDRNKATDEAKERLKASTGGRGPHEDTKPTSKDKDTSKANGNADGKNSAHPRRAERSRTAGQPDRDRHPGRGSDGGHHGVGTRLGEGSSADGHHNNGRHGVASHLGASVDGNDHRNSHQSGDFIAQGLAASHTPH